MTQEQIDHITALLEEIAGYLKQYDDDLNGVAAQYYDQDGI